MIRALYDWTLRLAARPRAAYALGAVSFADSSFFPVPADTLLIPMAIADRARVWRLAHICWITSVLGAIAGYFIGSAFFNEVGRPLLELYGYRQSFSDFAVTYNNYGAWIVLVAGGLTPFPFKVVTIASGATGMDLWLFVASCVVARSSRYYMVAWLLYKFGPSVKRFLDRRLKLAFVIAVAGTVAGFAAVRLLV